MYALSLLGLADATSGWCIGDGHSAICRRGCTHAGLPAHVGFGSRLRFRRRRGGDRRRVQDRDDVVWTETPCGSSGHDVYKENGERVVKYGRGGMI